MSLSTWMSSCMKECLGTMMKELLLYNFQTILIFTVYGVTINDANTHDQHFLSTNELAQDSDAINGFLVDNPELFELPIRKTKEPVVDLIALLEIPTINESTSILNSIFDEIKPEDLIDLEKLFGSLITINEPIIDNNEEESSSMINQDGEKIFEGTPKKKTQKSGTWKSQLETLFRQIYTEKMNQIERIIVYYRIGKLIFQTPTKYK